MNKIIISLLLTFILISCKSHKAGCDAYSKLENKKDHQI